MLETLLETLKQLLKWLNLRERRRLLQLKKQERQLVEKIKSVYPNQDLITQLYHRLQWVRKEIQDIERK
jgi:hypothetical protein